MMYTISTLGQHVVLTLTPDSSINVPNLCRTDLLLDHARSSSIASMIFDMGSLSSLNTKGSWTIFRAVLTAQEHGKNVFLYNVQPSVKPVLAEAGLLRMVSVITTKEELDITYERLATPMAQPFHSHRQDKRTTNIMKGTPAEGHGDSSEVPA